LKVIKAIYNFIVGDMIILVGIILTAILLALLNAVNALAPLRTIEGVILVVAVLAVLTATLMREARGKR
jgi:membrane protein implicated in regulation of membrane protease activity